MAIFNYLKEHLFSETRRHSADQYLTIEQAIEKYKDYDDIYVHFSENFQDPKIGKNPMQDLKRRKIDREINQVGINVGQDYNNPFGIYAYPVFGKIKSLYRTNTADVAYFLKNKKIGRYIDKIDEMSSSEYDRCIDILTTSFSSDNPFNDDGKEQVHTYEFKNFIEQTKRLGKNKALGCILFYLINRMSDTPTYNKGNLRRNIFQRNVWHDLLGYTAISDNNGTGTIHQNEPYQIVFFSRKYFDVIDVVKNTTDDVRNIGLENAIENGSIDGVKKAIELGATITQRTMTIAMGYPKVLKYILMNNLYDISRISDSNKYHMLITAIKFNDIELSIYLVDNGAKISDSEMNYVFRNFYDRQALYVVVRNMLDNGLFIRAISANIFYNIVSNRGTPDLVKLIVDDIGVVGGIDIGIVTSSMQIPNNEEITKILLDKVSVDTSSIIDMIANYSIPIGHVKRVMRHIYQKFPRNDFKHSYIMDAIKLREENGNDMSWSIESLMDNTQAWKELDI